MIKSRDQMSDDELNKIIERCIWEVHRALGAGLNANYISAPYDAGTDHEQVANMVRMIRRGASYSEVQDAWLERMAQDGWKYGYDKDPVRKTSPGMTSWEKLGEWDRRKVILAFRICYVLALES